MKNKIRECIPSLLFLILLIFLLSATACSVQTDSEISQETATGFTESTKSIKPIESGISEKQPESTEDPGTTEPEESGDFKKSRNSEKSENTENSENPAIPEIPETTEMTEIPENVLIEDVPYYSQKNVLATGCEIISAKMLLEYYSGQETEIEEMLSVMSCQPFQLENGRLYAPHPEDAFVGNPYSESGYGCFAPVIVRMLNHLLPDPYRAVDTSGTDLRELAQTWLPQGTPVLVWATIGMWNAPPTSTWYLYNSRGYATDHQFQWLANEHCMVLIGYDSDYYYFQDPYESNGTMKYRKDISEKRYEQIGCYSVIVTETSTENLKQLK